MVSDEKERVNKHGLLGWNGAAVEWADTSLKCKRKGAKAATLSWIDQVKTLVANAQCQCESELNARFEMLENQLRNRFDENQFMQARWQEKMKCFQHSFREVLDCQLVFGQHFQGMETRLNEVVTQQKQLSAVLNRSVEQLEQKCKSTDWSLLALRREVFDLQVEFRQIPDERLLHKQPMTTPKPSAEQAPQYSVILLQEKLENIADNVEMLNEVANRCCSFQNQVLSLIGDKSKVPKQGEVQLSSHSEGLSASPEQQHREIKVPSTTHWPARNQVLGESETLSKEKKRKKPKCSFIGTSTPQSQISSDRVSCW